MNDVSEMIKVTADDSRDKSLIKLSIVLEQAENRNQAYGDESKQKELIIRSPLQLDGQHANEDGHIETSDGQMRNSRPQCFLRFVRSWRCIILSAFVSALFVVLLWFFYLRTLLIRSSQNSTSCNPGQKGDIASQLPLHVWRPPTAPSLVLPLYTTHTLNEQDQKQVVTAIIVQHGNLRNANDYYCAAVNSLGASGSPQSFVDSVAIIAPQFSTAGDLCWDATTGQARVRCTTLILSDSDALYA
jgi:hypothetical protein